MRMKTLILGATVLVGVAFVAVPLASADRPIRVQVPAADATGQFCEDFPVLVHPTRNNEYATIFSTGATFVTGALRVEVSNLDTGETIALNIPGPGFFSPDGTTLIGTGPWLLYGEEDFIGPGSGAECSSSPVGSCSRSTGRATSPGTAHEVTAKTSARRSLPSVEPLRRAAG